MNRPDWTCNRKDCAAMSEDSHGWRWIDVEMSDLAGQTFESLTTKYRSEKPTALVTRLSHLEGYMALNLFSPLHSAFWAAANSRTFFASTFDSVRYLDKAWARVAFKKDLRQAKIRHTDPQIRFFDDYANVLQISGKSVPSLSEDSMTYPEAWRFWSHAFPEKFRAEIVDFLEQELCDFGKFSFFRIDESVHLADPRSRSSVGGNLFSFVDYIWFGSQVSREEFEQKILGELKVAVMRMEGGRGFDTPIEPIWLIKGHVSFHSHTNTSISMEILSYRARLVNLLEWPQQYRSVSDGLNYFKQQKEEGNFVHAGPYDIEFELTSYMEKMIKCYPILGRELVLQGKDESEDHR